ncbi:hypothetical protein LOAG_13338, partial [Loa loa]
KRYPKRTTFQNAAKKGKTAMHEMFTKPPNDDIFADPIWPPPTSFCLNECEHLR